MALPTHRIRYPFMFLLSKLVSGPLFFFLETFTNLCFPTFNPDSRQVISTRKERLVSSLAGTPHVYSTLEVKGLALLSVDG